jgi:hypothetical protein
MTDMYHACGNEKYINQNYLQNLKEKGIFKDLEADGS